MNALENDDSTTSNLLVHFVECTYMYKFNGLAAGGCD